jgi:hypothetical protein
MLWRQNFVGRLLDRKPGRRLGMLKLGATDIKQHKWFEGMDWEALAARKIQPPRTPGNDSAKRIAELTVAFLLHVTLHGDLYSLHTVTEPRDHVHNVLSDIQTTIILTNRMGSGHLQEGERKSKPPPKETPEELAECTEVFADF